MAWRPSSSTLQPGRTSIEKTKTVRKKRASRETIPEGRCRRQPVYRGNA